MTLGEALGKLPQTTGRSPSEAQRLRDGLQTLADNGIKALTDCGMISTAQIMDTVVQRPPEGVAMALLTFAEAQAISIEEPTEELDTAIRALQSVRAIRAVPLDNRLSLEDAARLIALGWEAGLDHLGVSGSNQGFWRDADTRRNQKEGRAAGGRRSGKKRLWWHDLAAKLLLAEERLLEPRKTLQGRVANIINETAWREERVKQEKLAVRDRTVRSFDEAQRRAAKQNRSA